MILVLVFQPAMLVRHILICGLPAVQYVSTLSYKGNEFRTVLLDIKYMFGFSIQLSPETFLILRKTEQDVIKNVH